MTCEDEEREKFEVKLKELRQQLDMLLQTEQNDLSLDIKLQMSDIYLTMQTQLGSSEECRQRKEFRENQLRYIDQMLSEGNLQGDHDGGTDEVKDYTTDDSRERPVKVHRSNTFAESSGRRMYPTNSSGVPGKILWRRPSPNQNGIHIRQRSNPEQGRLAHELMMRSRVDPASSVGDLPANFPALGARRSSRSPRQSNEHLDTSATSINSFNLQGRASTNASLQSLDMSYPHHSISAADSYLSSSAHCELSRFDSSFNADYNDLRGELRGTQFGDQRMGAVSKPHRSLSTRLTSLAADGSLASKVDMIQSLLTMLRSSDQDEMSRTLLTMANSKESCVAMRQSGCIPLLLQILHPRGEDGVTVRSSREAKMRATATLHNIIHLQGHSHESVREMNVLQLLEQVRTLTDIRRLQVEKATNRRDIPLTSANMKLMAEQQRPGHSIESLMQLSYKQEYRPAILLLGGVYAVGELLEADHKAMATSVMSRDDSNINRLHPGTDLHRHCCVILTNLTFGGAAVKIELCRMINCLHIIVLQLESHSEELVKAAGNILRNLSWNTCTRGDDVAGVDESVVNLLAFKENKADICAESGGLKLILHLLKHWTSARYSEDIVQNAAGILLNISSYVSLREAYRQRQRESGLYQVLVELLKLDSPEMLEKVCGILWNLSSRSAADQSKLWDLGAVPALHRLTKSVKDPKIQKAAAQALKNLMQAKGGGLGGVVEATGSRNGCVSITG
ncbi:LOW QUALITY PROTEIN: adenomatous polyposis coli protein-like [Corticium candelabrum]|uniref:LOW QUALITY PROTEIN: adenomatous polyposis coli protein-like n=1 Tax=Corticium candelabrum TaxID=121492 RepID=UPI002E25BB16|nr:LOW QUALITY PROTEIN: adenomatous polyposis coli protein-like [Corticium candelabrum]